MFFARQRKDAPGDSRNTGKGKYPLSYRFFVWHMCSSRLFSFLPNVTATLVSKRYASGDMDGTQDAVCQALMLGILISIFGTTFMFTNPIRALSTILKGKKEKEKW